MTPEVLDEALPKTRGGGVLSVDLLLAARRRGFDAALVAGGATEIRTEVLAGRPAILMLRLLDLPGARKDVFHYVVVDGIDPGRGLFRLQFGDGTARWTALSPLEKSWAAVDHALLLVRPKPVTLLELHRAVGLEEAGRLDEAEALYRSVLAVRPDWALAWTDLGNALVKRGRRAEAEKAYREALRIAPESDDALNNLAFLLLQEGSRLEEAEALAQRAAAVPGPDRHEALDTLGRVQLARGRCPEAALTFGEALAIEGLLEVTRQELESGLEEARLSCAPPET